jgi:predicted transposase YbfD/YdcC
VGAPVIWRPLPTPPGSPERLSWPELQALAIGCHLPLPVQQSPAAGIRSGAAGLDGQPDPRSWIIEMVSATTRRGSTTIRRHLFLASIRTTPENMLRLIRQRWSIENEWHWARDAQLGEHANRYANHTGVPVFSLLKTVVMNLLSPGGYRSIRQGLRELANDIKGVQMASLLETVLILFLIRFLKLLLKPKAAAAPKIGRGPGTGTRVSATNPTG